MLNKYKVAVVGGAGHIGLPLSCYISSKGNEVLIVDIDEKVLSKIKNNEVPFFEDGLKSYIDKANKNNIQTSTDLKKIKDFNFIIVTLGTSSEKDEIEKFRGLVSEIIDIVSVESHLILEALSALMRLIKLVKINC